MAMLNRTLDQWRGGDPAVIAEGSEAAVRYALADAKHDVLALATEGNALVDLLKQVPDPKDFYTYDADGAVSGFDRSKYVIAFFDWACIRDAALAKAGA